MLFQFSRLGIPVCLLNLHSPVREKAKWDGKHYIGNCRHCGETIFRKERGVWKKQKAKAGTA